ncbi:luciferase family protein [Streptacidiphilus jiangxiensis]|uniref:luciferase domain-containing protein n=1 Tax=Streptacidiphilus jiangxiensis TaxID=235985 RepID=UPI0005A9C5F2|nr:luciferase family protein [Streptacidiphilus jiangxiensis]
MDAAEYALQQLTTWPDLSPGPPSCDVGRALVAGSNEIVHIHSARSADVHLTATVIRRMRGELERSHELRLQGDSPWVTIRIESPSGARLLFTLTSLALHAHARREGDPVPAAPCSAAAGSPPAAM